MVRDASQRSRLRWLRWLGEFLLGLVAVGGIAWAAGALRYDLPAQDTSRQGIALVRTRAAFAPFGLGEAAADQLNFSDPVVLLRAPFRVSFSYSPGDGSWSDTWHNAGQLPSVVRFLVSDLTTGRTLAVSSATMVHVELPADCAGAASQACGGSQSSPAANGAAGAASGARARQAQINTRAG